MEQVLEFYYFPIYLIIHRLWLTKQDYLETGATLNVQEGQVYEQNEPQCETAK